MNYKTKMRRISGISLIFCALLLAFMPSCGKKGGTATTSSKVIVEQIKPVSEALLPLLDSYTSGVITEGEPIVVRFKDPQMLKVKSGESIPSKAFSFKPELKGKAVWLDENTIAYEYDKIDETQQYVCDFKISEFVDVPVKEPLQFSFGVRRQNFSLALVAPQCTSKDEMSYQLCIVFATPVEADDAIKIFDDAFVKKHDVKSTYLGDNTYTFEVGKLERKNADYQLELNLSGKPLKSPAPTDRPCQGQIRACRIRCGKRFRSSCSVFLAAAETRPKHQRHHHFRPKQVGL